MTTTTPTTTTDRIREALVRGLGDVGVRVARPDRRFQLFVPAYALDGDGLQVFVEPVGADFLVTDLGATFMRASYAGELSRAQEDAVTDLARRQGLELEEGALRVTVREENLLAAVFGLVQTQVSVEAVVDQSRVPKRVRAEEDFRAIVREMLAEAFRGRVTFDKVDEADVEKDFPIDAYIEGKHPVGLAIVANNLAAERAVGTKLQLAPTSRFRDVEWLSIPRDVAKLSPRTRSRLDRAYQPVVSAFETSERGVVIERLRRRAA